MSAIRKVFAKKKVGDAEKLAPSEIFALFKNVFYNHVLTYIYTRVGKIVEKEAILDFYNSYKLQENDWELDSAIKCWQRYKLAMGLHQTRIFQERVFQPRKVVRRQVITTSLFLF
jgi:hypothetical protein